MNPAIKALNNLAIAWAEVVWAVSWQALLIVGGFAIVAWIIRRSSPSLRSWLWQIAAIKLLIMPLWGASMVSPMASKGDPGQLSQELPTGQSGLNLAGRVGDPIRVAGMTEVGANPSQPGNPRFEPVDWRVWPMVGWTCLVSVQVAAIFGQRRRLIRFLSRSNPADDPALLSLVGELSGRIGLTQPPRVVLIDEGGSPFVCDPRRPTLVLPRSLPLEALRPILLHELCHLKRRDLIWGWVPAVARVLYVFHPAAHYIAFRARLERELACDQAAMVLTGQCAATYASTLVDVVTRTSIPPTLRTVPPSTRLDLSHP